MTTQTEIPYVKALACSIITFAVGFGALLMGYALPSIQAGKAGIPELLALALVPGLVVGLFAKRSVKPWPLWLIISAFIVLLIVVTVAHEALVSWRMANGLLK
ncbi:MULTISPECIES: hypothetical protein [unclassified Phyllobacterium]|uniref:hypothetical protein n=1 Tax=Phyllobacterium TaxID=28100 RepID=UPI000DD50318|nr:MULTISPECIES: hypothetical protein [unclassified Phyllobacterium]MBA8899147.1 hypothetical protein [Phyllobacterium sp. P30BS-XVII]UGX85199.1 hypothetical protein LLE53_012015 [Phyllobacterium sp. T1293]